MFNTADLNINDLDVFTLDSRALVDEACALLYRSCIDVSHPWKFQQDNPSQIRVETRNGQRVLVDMFTDTAEWFGVFHGDEMVACGRLISSEHSPTGKLECESYPSTRTITFPCENRLELNRVALARKYQDFQIHNLIYLESFERCRRTKKTWVGCSSHPRVKKLFQKIEFKPMCANAFKYAETDPIAVDVYCADYRQLKVLCKNLQATLKPLKTVFDALELVAPIVPVPLYWHDTQGHVLGLNDACLEIMGAPGRAAIIGKTPFDFYPEDTATMIWSHSEEVIRRKEILSQDEPINQIESGEYMYAKAIKAPFYDSNGKVVGIIGCSVDITAEKLADQLKKSLNEAQRIALAEKEKYIAIARKVAHDVASPLTALQIISKAFTSTNVPEDAVKIFQTSLDRISAITSELLTTYRLAENGQPIGDASEHKQTICVYEHVAQIIEEKKIQSQSDQVHFKLHAELIARTAIANLQINQFHRALSNLLNNAVDAMENAAGTVIIKLEATQTGITLTVSDTGKGMPDTVKQTILAGNRITEGKKSGNGMGMQVVWDLLNQNEGTMQIYSERGCGTSIQITFPRS